MKKLGALLVLSVALPLCAMQEGEGKTEEAERPLRDTKREREGRQGDEVPRLQEKIKGDTRNKNTATNLKNWRAMRFFGLTPKQAIGVGLVLTATGSSFKHIETRRAQGKPTIFEEMWIKSRKFVRKLRDVVRRKK
jgi:hypothetical protein